jgi:hypothetical protein
MKTRDFLKQYNLSMPKGWRRFRLGESFNCRYGVINSDGRIDLNGLGIDIDYQLCHKIHIGCLFIKQKD